MDFPPVINLVSATFSEMTSRVPTPGTETLQASQPTADSGNANSGKDGSFQSDFAESKSGLTGQHLNEKA